MQNNVCLSPDFHVRLLKIGVSPVFKSLLKFHRHELLSKATKEILKPFSVGFSRRETDLIFRLLRYEDFKMGIISMNKIRFPLSKP